MIKHFEATGCDIIGQSKTERKDQPTIGRRVNIHQSKRLNYTKKLGRSLETVKNEGAKEKEIPEANSFESLTVEDTVLIASSSKEIERLPVERMCRYRELVEQLMRNTGIIFNNESMRRVNSQGMYHKQVFHLKKVTTDFRRQTRVEGINDKMSTNQDCGLEGCSKKN
jgi:hypothetical protein